MTEADLNAIEVRANAATVGPWTYDSKLDRKYYGSEVRSAEGAIEVWRFGKKWEPSEEQLAHWGHPSEEERDDLCCDSHYQTVSDLADIRFIAHARMDVPALLAEVRRLQAKMRCEWCNGAGERWYRDDVATPSECHNCDGTGEHRCRP